MLVGHYGPSFAIKAADRSIPLWLLFVAVQLVDIVWAVFVLLGIERIRIVPGFTATNAYDLYYIPYTHSLPATLFWVLAAAFAYRWSAGVRRSSSAWLGVAVLSHWLLDTLVHVSDLPLWDDVYKIGFGLWNYRWPAFGLELVVLVAGVWLYARAVDLTRRQLLELALFAGLMIGIQLLSLLLQPPPSADAAVLQALAAYLVLTLAAFWLETRQTARTVHSSRGSRS